jgi:hypothetical protein
LARTGRKGYIFGIPIAFLVLHEQEMLLTQCKSGYFPLEIDAFAPSKIWWLVKFALEKTRENSVFTSEEIDAAQFYIDDFLGI